MSSINPVNEFYVNTNVFGNVWSYGTFPGKTQAEAIAKALDSVRKQFKNPKLVPISMVAKQVYARSINLSIDSSDFDSDSITEVTFKGTNPEALEKIANSFACQTAMGSAFDPDESSDMPLDDLLVEGF